MSKFFVMVWLYAGKESEVVSGLVEVSEMYVM
jgi:hypothetical protein